MVNISNILSTQPLNTLISSVNSKLPPDTRPLSAKAFRKLRRDAGSLSVGGMNLDAVPGTRQLILKNKEGKPFKATAFLESCSFSDLCNLSVTENAVKAFGGEAEAAATALAVFYAAYARRRDAEVRARISEMAKQCRQQRRSDRENGTPRRLDPLFALFSALG